jgi:hypothetical protein
LDEALLANFLGNFSQEFEAQFSGLIAHLLLRRERLVN